MGCPAQQVGLFEQSHAEGHPPPLAAGEEPDRGVVGGFPMFLGVGMHPLETLCVCLMSEVGGQQMIVV